MQRKNSNHKTTLSNLLLIASALGADPVLGCHIGQHPDEKTAVYERLTQNQLSSVEVFQDRKAGVITLKGIVPSEDGKKKAENLTAQAAPGYTIQNQLTVENTGIVSMGHPSGSAATGSASAVTTVPAK